MAKITEAGPEKKKQEPDKLGPKSERPTQEKKDPRTPDAIPSTKRENTTGTKKTFFG